MSWKCACRRLYTVKPIEDGLSALLYFRQYLSSTSHGLKADCRDGVSGHLKPASDGRNDPATIIGVSRHFSFNQAHCNLLLSGLFEREMPLSSKHLPHDRLAGSFRPFVAGLISTDDKMAAAFRNS